MSIVYQFFCFKPVTVQPASTGEQFGEQFGERMAQRRWRHTLSFPVSAKNRQFHLQNVRIPRAKSPWMAILGSKRHGCRLGSDPTVLKYLYTFC
ncbi:MAG: hypothetical protein HFI44_04645 [Lachnospiraceae bacterium]|nr:hypothetical protein [Lachnospiraceae bacterium]